MMVLDEKRKRLSILDIFVDAVDKKVSIDIIKDFLKGDKACSIFAANPEKNFSVPKDRELYKIFKKADLIIPDGIGIVIAARILHRKKLKRVPGVELMEDICRLAIKENKSVFFYGAKEDVNKLSVKKLSERYPSLKIAGRSNGYVPETEMKSLINKIDRSGADILFLALGSPRQEKWFAKYSNKLKNVKVCQGIGGSLDTIAGTVKRAPYFWRKISLEWLYRLISEPKRIRRQSVLPIFAYKVLIERFRIN